MKTADFLKDHEEMIAEYKRKEQARKEAEKEHYKKVIESENQLTEVSNFFLNWLSENEAKLKGKRLYIQTGKSKFFENFLSEFDYTKCPIFEEKMHVFCCYVDGDNLKLRACVNGGKYEDNSYYCQYVDRTLFDVIKTTNDGYFESIRTNKSDYKKYNYSEFSDACDSICDLKKKIKDIELHIDVHRANIPYSLQGILR